METTLLYIKICPKKKGRWLKHCHIFSMTPKLFQTQLLEVVNYVNIKYSSDILIPMDDSVHPGIVLFPKRSSEIAEDIYLQFCELAINQDIPNSIRCVYITGELLSLEAVSIHLLPNCELTVKLGRYLDSSDKHGLFKI